MVQSREERIASRRRTRWPDSPRIVLKRDAMSSVFVILIVSGILMLIAILSTQLGDFNSTPPSLSIAILRDVGELTDAFLQSHPELPAHAVYLPNQRGVRPEPRRSISELGITCDSPLNTWTAGKPLDERAKKGAGKRLDYIFFRGPMKQPEGPNLQVQGRLKCTESNVVFTELMEGHEVSYSDHFGLEATLDILDDSDSIRSTNAEDHHSVYNSRLSQTLTSSLSALAAALTASRFSQRAHMFIFITILILAMFTIGFSSSSKTGSGHLNGLWTLIAVICGWTGSTALYSAVVWGEWEKSECTKYRGEMDV
jgi:sphingomyelin phosphodiesterase 2